MDLRAHGVGSGAGRMEAVVGMLQKVSSRSCFETSS